VTTVQSGRIGHSYDAILLCCKAYDLEGAMADIEPAIGAGTAIAPVLNGVKHLDLLVTRFGRQHVLGGMTAVNATMAPDGDIVEAPVKVEMTTFGEISGERSERCSAMQRAFAAGGMNVSVSETIPAPMWAKFTGWASGATVATLCRCRAGAIAAVSAGAAFVNAAIDECTRVATAEGYPPPDNIAEIIRGLFSQRGSQIGPSILVDMENGRPTEGEHNWRSDGSSATARPRGSLAHRRSLQPPSLRSAPPAALGSLPNWVLEVPATETAASATAP
jgi:2-dehydropantoate 2-reductase